ncbi:MAG TPA: hypothetical protein PLL33_07835 [Paracoccus sp. (in: a-proteobacteria)]|nr:hypothetical protein [Paracoccus sp. (in: a-proteobacteria)]
MCGGGVQDGAELAQPPPIEEALRQSAPVAAEPRRFAVVEAVAPKFAKERGAVTADAAGDFIRTF